MFFKKKLKDLSIPLLLTVAAFNASLLVLWYVPLVVVVYTFWFGK